MKVARQFELNTLLDMNKKDEEVLGDEDTLNSVDDEAAIDVEFEDEEIAI